MTFFFFFYKNTEKKTENEKTNTKGRMLQGDTNAPEKKRKDERGDRYL